MRRRGFIFGLAGVLTFPGIVQATSIMPVKRRGPIWLTPGVYVQEIDVSTVVPSMDHDPNPWFAPAGMNKLIVWGQKALEPIKPSALDQINRRRLEALGLEVRDLEV